MVLVLVLGVVSIMRCVGKIMLGCWRISLIILGSASYFCLTSPFNMIEVWV